MVLQEALKELMSGPGEAEHRGWAQEGGGPGCESRKPLLAWIGMFQKNAFGTSRARASASVLLVTLALERGAEEGSRDSPLAPYHIGDGQPTGYTWGKSGWDHRGTRRGSRILSLEGQPEASGGG